ncbi:unknown [Crocosphaera subtropica ATCC 51142]|uniref:VWFA domain-containing protein n=1 Tax=Crocosphaera subtropica (strain ATCC 51142 / BH68) TaxID=43989 RepID=B1WTS2_CROS5|nr:VWA domain-containing protein [Crocosphaera subtropica]ACB50388.1 unknown [Crocosphaera subtropica ATCC 51142]
MLKYRRKVIEYPLFYTPLILVGLFLAFALLFGLLNIGKPPVAVVIALDVSSSTYQGQSFNAPNTIMDQEVQAVNAYLEANAKLSNPNKVQILGIGGGKAPKLTASMDSSQDVILDQLNRQLNDPNLPYQLRPEPQQDDLDIVINNATEILEEQENHCKELLMVTDAGVTITQSAVTQATGKNIKLNSLVFGTESVPNLRSASRQTDGIYIDNITLSNTGGNYLEEVFLNDFFRQFNSNWKWIRFWLGCALIAFLWLLVLPLDRWVFQGVFNMSMEPSGKIALGIAFIGTMITVALMIAGGLPLISPC